MKKETILTQVELVLRKIKGLIYKIDVFSSHSLKLPLMVPMAEPQWHDPTILR